MKKGGRLKAVAVKVEPEDIDDEELGMASNIIIEVVDPLTYPMIPLNLGVTQGDKTPPIWVSLFRTRIDDYNGLVDSLDHVQQIINCLEDATNTHFSVVKTRRKSFGFTDFNPIGIKVYWGKDRLPYIILNKKLLDCQHGKYRRPMQNGEKKVGRPSFTPDGDLKYKVTKKLGCPAQIVLREILQFPDFKVVENTQWLQKVQSRCLKKAFHLGETVCSNRCFVVSLPKLEDHLNHAVEVANLKPVSLKVKKKRTTRVQEPIHPKIIEKIRELLCEGISGIKSIKEHIDSFVKEVLSNEEEIVSSESRRYNPRDQDIRNIIKKVQNDLHKAGNSLAGVQCRSILKDLGEIVSHSKNEKYLEHLKVHLDHLRATVKTEAPLESLNTGHSMKEEVEEPSYKRAKVTSEDQDAVNYTYSITDADHEAQMLYEDDLPVKGEVTHIYYYE